MDIDPVDIDPVDIDPVDIDELTDRMLIAHTLAAYCDYVDRSELTALMGLFTDDAVLDMGHGVVITGREGLREALIDRVGRWSTTSHHSSNVLITGYAYGQALVTSYVYALHDHPGRNETMHLWGRYEDEFVKLAGSWRIRLRRLRVAGVRTTVSSPIPDRFEGFARATLPTR